MDPIRNIDQFPPEIQLQILREASLDDLGRFLKASLNIRVMIETHAVELYSKAMRVHGFEEAVHWENVYGKLIDTENATIQNEIISLLGNWEYGELRLHRLLKGLAESSMDDIKEKTFCFTKEYRWHNESYQSLILKHSVEYGPEDIQTAVLAWANGHAWMSEANLFVIFEELAKSWDNQTRLDTFRRTRDRVWIREIHLRDILIALIKPKQDVFYQIGDEEWDS
jgi:hypothetical protein